MDRRFRERLQTELVPQLLQTELVPQQQLKGYESLNSLVMLALVMLGARYFAQLPHPVHVATWFEDLRFSRPTLPHPQCNG